MLRRHSGARLLCVALFPRFFPLGLRAEALLRVARLRRSFVVLRAECLPLLPCCGGSPLFKRPALGRDAVCRHAHACRRLIHKVDGLVGQKAVRQIALRERHRRCERVIADAEPVVLLIARPQPAQDGERLFPIRLSDLHALEAPLERRVLFDILAVLRKRRCTDDADLSAPERGLQDVRRVHRAFGAACADDGVQLVDK